jgi:peptidoglycan biosynthesis protein MviN/MurJ (putative lipid II flippase)
MKKAITPLVVIAISTLFAYALGGNSRIILGIPLVWMLVPYSLFVQLIAFVPALLNNTEKHYDLTGSLTFISITVIATITIPSISLEQAIAGLMVIAWAGRLGTFLFRRICKAK